MPTAARFAGPRIALPLLALTVAACSSGDALLEQVDPEAVALQPTFEQANAIIERECNACHSGLAEPRLDSCEAVRRNLGGILEEVFDDNSMPPGAWPRLSSEDRLTLWRWITQGAQGPCP